MKFGIRLGVESHTKQEVDDWVYLNLDSDCNTLQ